MTQVRIGGSFAPPLTDELLHKYRLLIDGVDPKTQLRDTLETLYNCSLKWWELPESEGKTVPHTSGVGAIVALDHGVRAALWEHVPWDTELKLFSTILDTIPTGELRNTAFHLLWHATELTLDREPITADKL